MIDILLPYKRLLRESLISERNLSRQLVISRTTLRKILNGAVDINFKSLQLVAEFFGFTVGVVSFPEGHIPDCSTVSTGYKIVRDGFESWKIHLMDFVDEFRTTQDTRLILLPPHREAPLRINALISSTVLELCVESCIEPPSWALAVKPLERPWFVSGMESLKASAILESPASFRSKNVFVLKNFLERA